MSRSTTQPAFGALLASLATVLSTPAQAELPATLPRAAILLSSAEGVSGSAAAKVRAALTREIESRVEVVPAEELARVLTERGKAVEICAMAEGCVISVARELKATVALVAELRLSSGQMAVSITRYDADKGVEAGSTTAGAPSGAEALARSLKAVVHKLFPEPRPDISVSVSAAPPAPSVERPAPPIVVVTPPAASPSVPPLPAPQPPATQPPATQPATGSAGPRVVLLGTALKDVDGGLDALTDGLIRARLQQLGSVVPVPEAEVTKALRDLRRDAGACRSDAACVARLATTLHADSVLGAELAAQGKTYVVTLTLMAPATAAAPARVTERMKRIKSLEMNVNALLGQLFPVKEGKPSAEAAPPVPAIASLATPAVPVPEPVRPPAAVSASPAASTSPAVHQRVLVLELQAIGTPPSTVVELPALISREIARHPQFDVASNQELRDLLALDKTKELVGCTSDAACVAEISKKLNADLIVNGSVGRLGQSLVLALALVDPKRPDATRRASDTFDTLEHLQAALPRTLAELFGWSESGPRAPAFHLPKGRKSSFAVFDLNASGVAPEVARNLTQVLSSEVKSVEGATVVSRDDITAMLQFDKEKSQLGCTEDTECMARIGGAMGVDLLVVGSVGKIADQNVVTLRLIDARRAEVANRHTESFKGADEQLIGATREAARRLLALDDVQAGSLAVTASAPAAEVFVDQDKVGRLPLPPIEKLAAGRHNIRVTKDGFFDWQSDLYVSPIETTVAWAQLKERPEKWYQKWWVWTAAGVVVAGAVGTTTYFALKPTLANGTATFK